MAVLFVFVILLLLMQIYEQILFSHSFAPIIFIQAAFLWSWGGNFGMDKVTMDFAFFAIAFNIKKMAAKMPKWSKSPVFDPFIRPAGRKIAILGMSRPISSPQNKKLPHKADFPMSPRYKNESVPNYSF